MKSLWNDQEAKKCEKDPLQLRVYTSRLLGQEPDLVLHGGGGNTSVKAEVTNAFGEKEAILYVKGSGWDLSTIEAVGFAPVRLEILKRMAMLDSLTDPEMVRMQRVAMIDPYAPNPSVEAILHAIIPFKYVDHTHADAAITLTNNEKGLEYIQEIYGDRVIVVPYVMPGFILAKKIYEVTKDIDWNQFEGMILMNHGVFSFSEDAKTSYERMIQIVTKAENYLEKQGALKVPVQGDPKEPSIEDLQTLARLRQTISKVKGSPMIATLGNHKEELSFANLPNVSRIATRGPITPDHVIRTKAIPVILGDRPEESIQTFAQKYQEYFKRNTNGHQSCLDCAPRFGIWPGRGIVYFGSSIKEVNIIRDITRHTIRAIQWGEAIGGWKALSEKDLFDMEYWILEQAKIAKKGSPLPFQGKVAVVTGAASGIGRACAKALVEKGAVVAAFDIKPDIAEFFKQPEVLGIVCDLTKEEKMKKALRKAVQHFGGLDILVSNAGFFPLSEKIAEMKKDTWRASLDINLTSHQKMLQECIPFLSQGIDPAVLMIASKNVRAPGPGASAYSVAKAGLTQLARVAALELGSLGIRVNVIHPNQVFDTGIWTHEILEDRARQYGMSVEQYKTNNLLKKEITSQDVAELACAMVGPIFSKTTGSQVTIDGGNERVI